MAFIDALLAAVPVPVVLVGADGCVERTGPGIAGITGRPVADVLGADAAALAARAVAAGTSVSGRLEDGDEATAAPVAGTRSAWLVLGDSTHRRAAETANALVRAGHRLADAVEPAGVLAALSDTVVPDVADWCAIHVARRADTPRLATVAHRDPQRRAIARDDESLWAAASGDAIARVMATVQPEVVDGLADLAGVTRLGLRSAAVLPLLARGRVLGTVSLFMAESGRPFDGRRLATAEALAAQAAVVLDNAQLLDEQAEVARTLQRSLLPHALPDVGGLDIAVRYRPAGRANEVGGDFYDVIATGADTWRLLVGDIAGKGAEAAALTSLVRHTLGAAALRNDGMADGLALANDALLRRTRALTFCTVAYADVALDGDGVALEVMTAGHPPVLVLRRDGTVEALASTGPVLGVVVAARFSAVETRLGPGDAVVLYTDGAVELRGLPTEAGEAGLRAVLAGAAGRSAAELLERIEHNTLVLGGGAPRDDLALLALRVPD